jgi:multidrug efflux pump subunit AcrB
LTLIGIMIGHWLFGAPFTATSMIGFIALAGIIVRNSILLVDFIRHRRADDVPLKQALLEAGAIRFKPILLTALAAMIGAAVILFDPIFQGLAISLLFGLASSTLLTVLVIPAIYVVLRDDGRALP